MIDPSRNDRDYNSGQVVMLLKRQKQAGVIITMSGKLLERDQEQLSLSNLSRGMQ